MGLISLELDDEAKNDAIQPIAMSSKPDYNYGLCISLCDHELKKLGIDPANLSVGGVIHFEALAKITSISAREDEDAPSSRVELQVQDMGLLSPEKTEAAPRRAMRLYDRSN